jgi:hypothetical protein
MKKIIPLAFVLLFLSGCSWIGNRDRDNPGNGGVSGVDYGPGRGTTGISSGADAGQGITGSDAAPPR